MAKGRARPRRHTASDYAPWGLEKLARTPQVYAREVRTRKLVFLPENGKDYPLRGGDSRSAADRTKAGEFECLVQGCGRFSHISGGSKRHCWVHPQGSDGTRPGHDPESLWHLQVKQHFADWVEQQIGRDRVAELHIDDHWIPTATGPIRPDVYIELTTGERIAIEIQYSPGAKETVKKKRQAYAAAGVVDWWIYAPGPDTLQLDRNDRRRIRLIASQVTLLREGRAFYWFDLTRNRIATPYSYYSNDYRPRDGEDWTGLTEKGKRWPPIRSGWYVNLAENSLDQCEIVDGHFRTPVDHQFVKNAEARTRWEPVQRGKARAKYVEVMEARERAKAELEAMAATAEYPASHASMPAEQSDQRSSAQTAAEPLARLQPPLKRQPRPDAVETPSSPASGRRSGFWRRLGSRFGRSTRRSN
ncbi:hypothetical protein GCM10009745_38960 [Kribbella yunnanensis]|uniref:Competence protein CoiA nuclease-like domain-containing protein n=2 Tax=Kribbella yunnanensis TaxID=190194 RepID=A0ABN2HLD0_9ACTN